MFQRFNESARRNRLGWLVVVTAVAGALILGLRLAPPVLWVVREPGAVDPGDIIVSIQNPLRNRAPERAAEALFAELREGRCDHPAVRKRFCETERSYPMKSWSLVDRDDGPDGESKIHYRVRRRGYEARGWANVMVWVQRERGQYRVTAYIAGY